MAKVVVTNRIPAEGIALLEAEHDVTMWDSDECISREQALDLVKGADAVLTLLTEKVDDEFLAAAGDQLKVVANVAVGYNNIDVAACEKRGVIATNTPRVLTDATADTAFGLLLMVTRRFAEADQVIRTRTPWQWGMFYMLGTGLQGKTIGLVGAGQIGIAMARRAKAFGMDIVYTDAYEMKPEVAAEVGARRLEIDELLETADVVSLHCPLIPEGQEGSTFHLIDTAALERMKPTAFLINTARGPIVDEAALVKALQQGQIAGVGLDVFEKEPQVPEELVELDNVVLLPHLGSATIETRTAMAVLAARNAVAVLAGDKPETPVTHI